MKPAFFPLRHLLTPWLLLVLSVSAFARPVEISFYFPVAVRGPITEIIDRYADEFHREHPDIRVRPIYAGTYKETIFKALAAHHLDHPPVTSVLFSTDMHTLIDNDAIVPFDDLAVRPEDKAWLAGFFPALMTNSRAGGKTWGIPFQRSTILLYWNKDLFREAGLNPDVAPPDWNTMTRYAKALNRRDSFDAVTRWGLQIPSSGFPYWLYQGLTTTNGVELMNEAGTETRFDAPQAIEALQYWVDLARKHLAHPPGEVEWGTTPQDFLDGKAAMIWTTTGNLTFLKKNAGFDFGVAMLPANKRRGSPTGGGNFYIFKRSTPEQRQAAFKFIKWITSPERAARWSIDTGYIAVRPDAWETPLMKTYVARFPEARMARDQLQYAVAELSTHQNQRVTKVLNDALREALTGVKTPAQALHDAQVAATRILRPYRRPAKAAVRPRAE